MDDVFCKSYDIGPVPVIPLAGFRYGVVIAVNSPASTVVRVANSAIVNNEIAMNTLGDGLILTAGNNTVEGNVNNTAFTGSYRLK